MNKLYKNKNMVAILTTTLSLAAILNACTPSKENKEEPKEEQISSTLEYEKTEENQEETTKEESNKEIIEEQTQEESDKEIKEYVDELREEVTELKDYSEEKWQSEEVQEKRNNVKEKAKSLFDFIFNGKEINGITFKDLSEEGKQITLNGFYELDGYIELLIPNYKERLYDWTVDKGADAKETYDSLKEWFEKYKEDVLEEENSRKIKSK